MKPLNLELLSKRLAKRSCPSCHKLGLELKTITAISSNSQPQLAPLVICSLMALNGECDFCLVILEGGKTNGNDSFVPWGTPTAS